MKKILSLFLSLLMLLSLMTCFTASAVSLREGPEAAYESFEDGESALDYVYFSPVKGEEDTTKYPLILWLHGNSSGDYPGHQLRNSDIYKFSTDELQARFKDSGGAFLLLPRDPTNSISLAWDFAVEDAKRVLDDFISENIDNIDLDRIYAGGNSMGGKGVYKIAAAYPEVFAAIFPISPVYIPTNTELKALSDTAVWVFNNSNDNYPQLSDTSVKTYFNYLNKHSSNPQNNRWSCFSEYYSTGGFIQQDEIHNTWTPVLNDLFMDDGSEYKAISTVDGEGNSIKLTYPEGFISWLSSQTLSESVTSVWKNPFAKIIDFFISIFNALLSIFGV
ncbi:MAG: prolyl oligopeptidase family serine peptidase [Clostridia bacterium]|nr:prolyl oligopeptidase family serine peptidase [Clostridia bacterium]